MAGKGKKAKRPEYRRSKPNLKIRSRRRLTLTPRESTEYTGIGITMTYALLKSGELPSIKVGTKFYILREQLLQWLKDRASMGAANAAA
jgi:excisionase family DNA binding protein